MPRSAVLLLLCIALAGCGTREGARDGEDAPQRTIRVLAAADLQAALPEVAAAFHARTGVEVEMVFGSTGNLTTQIENGAPADLFLAASETFVDRLERGGHTVPGTRRIYAVGRLALAWRREGTAPDGLAALAAPDFRTVAIANPEHAPYGLAAREALQAAGVWDAVARRLVLAENVAQVLQFVRSGNADAGVVALALALAQPGTPHRVVDAALHAPLLQAGVVLRGSADADAAGALLAELAAGPGRVVLLRHGFEPPP